MSDPMRFVEFCNSLKPGTREHVNNWYNVFAWQEAEKLLIGEFLQTIQSLAPNLLVRGAMDMSIRLYRAELETYAKGGRQLVVLDAKAICPDPGSWARRILIHELVHTADSFRETSNSTEYRNVLEPRLRLAQELLSQKGFTPAEAASLQLGDQRDQLEFLVRDNTGLPSALASMNLSESLAEIASFWIEPDVDYDPPDVLKQHVGQFLTTASMNNEANALYMAAETATREKKLDTALELLTDCIAANERFHIALSLRAYVHEQFGNHAKAAADMDRCVEIISPLEHGYQFYIEQRDRLAKAE